MKERAYCLNFPLDLRATELQDYICILKYYFISENKAVLFLYC